MKTYRNLTNNMLAVCFKNKDVFLVRGEKYESTEEPLLVPSGINVTSTKNTKKTNKKG